MLNKSADYEAAREKLRQAEIALKEQREAVAALRRELPQGPALENYRFVEGPRALNAGDGPETEVALDELFEGGVSQLAVIHFMYKDGDEAPCPMCSMWADGYDAVIPHLQQHMPVVMVAKAPVAKLRAHARSRGWSNMRYLSSGGSSFNADFGVESPDGAQMPGFSVLTKDATGEVRQFYTGYAMNGEGHFRGLDLLSPVWNILDLTPQGRGEWFPSLNYA